MYMCLDERTEFLINNLNVHVYPRFFYKQVLMSIGSWREAALSHLVPVVLEARSSPHLDRRKGEHPGNNSEEAS